MRIAMLTTGHSALDDRIFFKEACSLARAGHEVSVIASKTPPASEREGIRLVWARPLFRGRLGRLAGLLKAALDARADVLHAHEHDSFMVAVMVKWLRPRTRVVYDVHEWYPELVYRSVPGLSVKQRGIKALRQGFDAWFSRHADGVITAVEPLVARYRAYTNDRVPVVAIGHYPPLERFPSAPLPEKPDREISFFYAGGISQDRGLDEMLEGVAALVSEGFSPRLLLCGAFLSEEDRRRFETRSSALNLEDRVSFLGWVDHERVHELTAQADVCLVLLHPIPVYLQALPIKLYEYMACGRAVLASDLPLVRPVVEETECGLLVDVTNREQVRDAFLRLAEDPELRRTLGANGRAAAEARYHWGSLEPILLDLVEGRAGTREVHV